MNAPLPMITSVDEDEHDPELIAYRFWFDYMQAYRGEGVNSQDRLTDARYSDFQLLAGSENEFAVAVNFWVQLEEERRDSDHSWGEVQEDETIRDIHWTFRIQKTNENEYTLTSIDDTGDTIGGLPPLEDTFQKEAGIDVLDENNRYRIENDTLSVTYDNGENWTEVPVDVGQLFEGHYNATQSELMEDSYIIIPERTAFIIGGLENINVLQSTDQGETWDEAQEPSPFRAIRMRIIDYVSDDVGFLILTGDRTMGAEANRIFITEDDGTTWGKL